MHHNLKNFTGLEIPRNRKEINLPLRLNTGLYATSSDLV